MLSIKKLLLEADESSKKHLGKPKEWIPPVIPPLHKSGQDQSSGPPVGNQVNIVIRWQGDPISGQAQYEAMVDDQHFKATGRGRSGVEALTELVRRMQQAGFLE